MAIYIGGNKVSKLYAGGVQVKKVYLGERQIYSTEPIYLTGSKRTAAAYSFGGNTMWNNIAHNETTAYSGRSYGSNETYNVNLDLTITVPDGVSGECVVSLALDNLPTAVIKKNGASVGTSSATFPIVPGDKIYMQGAHWGSGNGPVYAYFTVLVR